VSNSAGYQIAGGQTATASATTSEPIKIYPPVPLAYSGTSLSATVTTPVVVVVFSAVITGLILY
jgi:hypothetical protein